MQPGKKLLTKLLPTCLVLMAMLLVACGGGSTTTTTSSKAPASQQVLNMCFYNGVSDIKTFDPALSTDVNSIEAIDLVFTGLVQFDDNLKIQPQLASSYDLASDGLKWTFHLRPNLKFSDGTPLTSADVVYSINRALLPATKSVVGPVYLALIKDSDKLNAGKIPTIIGDSLLTPDPNTVVIIANKKASYFLDALAYSTSFVVEKSLIDKYGDTWTDHLNTGGGDGPFEVQAWNHGTNVVLVPNPTYYGPHPQLTKLIYPFYKVTDTNFKAYQAGQTDYATLIPTADLDTARALPNNQYQLVPQLSINYLTMNYLVKPFDNIHIRQAFALAINKDLIIQSVYKNTYVPTNHIVPKGMPGYNPNLMAPDGVAGTSGDPTKAKALLQQGLTEEGWTSVSQLPAVKLTYASGDPNLANAMAAMQQMWQTTLGVSVKTNPEDFNKLLTDSEAALNNPNGLQFWAIGWIADYPDPQDWTSLQFGKGQQYNQINYGQNNSANAAQQQQVQQALDAADVNPDQNARLQAYMQAEQQLVNDVAWLSWAQVAFSQVLKPYVKGIVFNALLLYPPNDWGNIYIAAH
ncbi:MAG TPA: peptide ABC transporter substrate-binding protein [Ktedonobacteraceae bacterium]|nr:peptide ABC transporter substrate-binding protein [Ktedonobacteraceae bacterium]